MKTNLCKLSLACRLSYLKELWLVERYGSTDDLQLSFIWAKSLVSLQQDNSVQQCKANLALTESLCSCHSLAVILIKKPFYKVFSFGCESGPWGLIETWLCLQDSSKDSWLRSRPERPTPAKQDIGNHSNAPHICLSAIRSVQHLRSNVVCTSNNVIESFICRTYNMALWPTVD